MAAAAAPGLEEFFDRKVYSLCGASFACHDGDTRLHSLQDDDNASTHTPHSTSASMGPLQLKNLDSLATAYCSLAFGQPALHACLTGDAAALSLSLRRAYGLPLTNPRASGISSPLSAAEAASEPPPLSPHVGNTIVAITDAMRALAGKHHARISSAPSSAPEETGTSHTDPSFSWAPVFERLRETCGVPKHVEDVLASSCVSTEACPLFGAPDSSRALVEAVRTRRVLWLAVLALLHRKWRLAAVHHEHGKATQLQQRARTDGGGAVPHSASNHASVITSTAAAADSTSADAVRAQLQLISARLPDDTAYLVRLYCAHDDSGGEAEVEVDAPRVPHSSSSEVEVGGPRDALGPLLGEALFAHYSSPPSHSRCSSSSSLGGAHAAAVSSETSTTGGVSLSNWLQFLEDSGVVPSSVVLPSVAPSVDFTCEGGCNSTTSSSSSSNISTVEPLSGWPAYVLKHICELQLESTAGDAPGFPLTTHTQFVELVVTLCSAMSVTASSAPSTAAAAAAVPNPTTLAAATDDGAAATPIPATTTAAATRAFQLMVAAASSEGRRLRARRRTAFAQLVSTAGVDTLADEIEDGAVLSGWRLFTGAAVGTSPRQQQEQQSIGQCDDHAAAAVSTSILRPVSTSTSASLLPRGARSPHQPTSTSAHLLEQPSSATSTSVGSFDGVDLPSSSTSSFHAPSLQSRPALAEVEDGQRSLSSDADTQVEVHQAGAPHSAAAAAVLSSLYAHVAAVPSASASLLGQGRPPPNINLRIRRCDGSFGTEGSLTDNENADVASGATIVGSLFNSAAGAAVPSPSNVNFNLPQHSSVSSPSSPFDATPPAPAPPNFNMGAGPNFNLGSGGARHPVFSARARLGSSYAASASASSTVSHGTAGAAAAGGSPVFAAAAESATSASADMNTNHPGLLKLHPSTSSGGGGSGNGSMNVATGPNFNLAGVGGDGSVNVTTVMNFNFGGGRNSVTDGYSTPLHTARMPLSVAGLGVVSSGSPLHSASAGTGIYVSNTAGAPAAAVGGGAAHAQMSLAATADAAAGGSPLDRSLRRSHGDSLGSEGIYPSSSDGTVGNSGSSGGGASTSSASGMPPNFNLSSGTGASLLIRSNGYVGVGAMTGPTGALLLTPPGASNFNLGSGGGGTPGSGGLRSGRNSTDGTPPGYGTLFTTERRPTAGEAASAARRAEHLRTPRTTPRHTPTPLHAVYLSPRGERGDEEVASSPVSGGHHAYNLGVSMNMSSPVSAANFNNNGDDDALGSGMSAVAQHKLLLPLHLKDEGGALSSTAGGGGAGSLTSSSTLRVPDEDNHNSAQLLHHLDTRLSDGAFNDPLSVHRQRGELQLDSTTTNAVTVGHDGFRGPSHAHTSELQLREGQSVTLAMMRVTEQPSAVFHDVAAAPGPGMKRSVSVRAMEDALLVSGGGGAPPTSTSFSAVLGGEQSSTSTPSPSPTSASSAGGVTDVNFNLGQQPSGVNFNLGLHLQGFTSASAFSKRVPSFGNLTALLAAAAASAATAAVSAVSGTASGGVPTAGGTSASPPSATTSDSGTTTGAGSGTDSFATLTAADEAISTAANTPPAHGKVLQQHHQAHQQQLPALGRHALPPASPSQQQRQQQHTASAAMWAPTSSSPPQQQQQHSSSSSFAVRTGKTPPSSVSPLSSASTSLLSPPPPGAVSVDSKLKLTPPLSIDHRLQSAGGFGVGPKQQQQQAGRAIGSGSSGAPAAAAAGGFTYRSSRLSISSYPAVEHHPSSAVSSTTGTSTGSGSANHSPSQVQLPHAHAASPRFDAATAADEYYAYTHSQDTDREAVGGVIGGRSPSVQLQLGSGGSALQLGSSGFATPASARSPMLDRVRRISVDQSNDPSTLPAKIINAVRRSAVASAVEGQLGLLQSAGPHTPDRGGGGAGGGFGTPRSPSLSAQYGGGTPSGGTPNFNLGAVGAPRSPSLSSFIARQGHGQGQGGSGSGSSSSSSHAGAHSTASATAAAAAAASASSFLLPITGVIDFIDTARQNPSSPSTPPGSSQVEFSAGALVAGRSSSRHPDPVTTTSTSVSNGPAQASGGIAQLQLPSGGGGHGVLYPVSVSVQRQLGQGQLQLPSADAMRALEASAAAQFTRGAHMVNHQLQLESSVGEGVREAGTTTYSTVSTSSSTGDEAHAQLQLAREPSLIASDQLDDDAAQLQLASAALISRHRSHTVSSGSSAYGSHPHSAQQSQQSYDRLRPLSAAVQLQLGSPATTASSLQLQLALPSAHSSLDEGAGPQSARPASPLLSHAHNNALHANNNTSMFGAAAPMPHTATWANSTSIDGGGGGISVVTRSRNSSITAAEAGANITRGWRSPLSAAPVGAGFTSPPAMSQLAHASPTALAASSPVYHSAAPTARSHASPTATSPVYYSATLVSPVSSYSSTGGGNNSQSSAAARSPVHSSYSSTGGGSGGTSSSSTAARSPVHSSPSLLPPRPPSRQHQVEVAQVEFQLEHPPRQPPSRQHPQNAAAHVHQVEITTGPTGGIPAAPPMAAAGAWAHHDRRNESESGVDPDEEGVLEATEVEVGGRLADTTTTRNDSGGGAPETGHTNFNLRSGSVLASSSPSRGPASTNFNLMKGAAPVSSHPRSPSSSTSAAAVGVSSAAGTLPHPSSPRFAPGSGPNRLRPVIASRLRSHSDATSTSSMVMVRPSSNFNLNSPGGGLAIRAAAEAVATSHANAGNGFTCGTAGCESAAMGDTAALCSGDVDSSPYAFFTTRVSAPGQTMGFSPTSSAGADAPLATTTATTTSRQQHHPTSTSDEDHTAAAAAMRATSASALLEGSMSSSSSSSIPLPVSTYHYATTTGGGPNFNFGEDGGPRRVGPALTTHAHSDNSNSDRDLYFTGSATNRAARASSVSVPSSSSALLNTPQRSSVRARGERWSNRDDYTGTHSSGSGGDGAGDSPVTKTSALGSPMAHNFNLLPSPRSSTGGVNFNLLPSPRSTGAAAASPVTPLQRVRAQSIDNTRDHGTNPFLDRSAIKRGIIGRENDAAVMSVVRAAMGGTATAASTSFGSHHSGGSSAGTSPIAHPQTSTSGTGLFSTSTSSASPGRRAHAASVGSVHGSFTQRNPSPTSMSRPTSTSITSRHAVPTLPTSTSVAARVPAQAHTPPPSSGGGKFNLEESPRPTLLQLSTGRSTSSLLGGGDKFTAGASSGNMGSAAAVDTPGPMTTAIAAAAAAAAVESSLSLVPPAVSAAGVTALSASAVSGTWTFTAPQIRSVTATAAATAPQTSTSISSPQPQPATSTSSVMPSSPLVSPRSSVGSTGTQGVRSGGNTPSSHSSLSPIRGSSASSSSGSGSNNATTGGGGGGSSGNFNFGSSTGGGSSSPGGALQLGSASPGVALGLLQLVSVSPLTSRRDGPSPLRRLSTANVTASAASAAAAAAAAAVAASATGVAGGGSGTRPSSPNELQLTRGTRPSSPIELQLTRGISSLAQGGELQLSAREESTSSSCSSSGGNGSSGVSRRPGSPTAATAAIAAGPTVLTSLGVPSSSSGGSSVKPAPPLPGPLEMLQRRQSGGGSGHHPTSTSGSGGGGHQHHRQHRHHHPTHPTQTQTPQQQSQFPHQLQLTHGSSDSECTTSSGDEEGLHSSTSTFAQQHAGGDRRAAAVLPASSPTVASAVAGAGAAVGSSARKSILQLAIELTSPLRFLQTLLQGGIEEPTSTSAGFGEPGPTSTSIAQGEQHHHVRGASSGNGSSGDDDDHASIITRARSVSSTAALPFRGGTSSVVHADAAFYFSFSSAIPPPPHPHQLQFGTAGIHQLQLGVAGPQRGRGSGSRTGRGSPLRHSTSGSGSSVNTASGSGGVNTSGRSSSGSGAGDSRLQRAVYASTATGTAADAAVTATVATGSTGSESSEQLQVEPPPDAATTASAYSASSSSMTRVEVDTPAASHASRSVSAVVGADTSSAITAAADACEQDAADADAKSCSSPPAAPSAAVDHCVATGGATPSNKLQLGSGGPAEDELTPLVNFNLGSEGTDPLGGLPSMLTVAMRRVTSTGMLSTVSEGAGGPALTSSPSGSPKSSQSPLQSIPGGSRGSESGGGGGGAADGGYERSIGSSTPPGQTSTSVHPGETSTLASGARRRASSPALPNRRPRPGCAHVRGRRHSSHHSTNFNLSAHGASLNSSAASNFNLIALGASNPSLVRGTGGGGSAAPIVVSPNSVRPGQLQPGEQDDMPPSSAQLETLLLQGQQQQRDAGGGGHHLQLVSGPPNRDEGNSSSSGGGGDFTAERAASALLSADLHQQHPHPHQQRRQRFDTHPVGSLVAARGGAIGVHSESEMMATRASATSTLAATPNPSHAAAVSGPPPSSSAWRVSRDELVQFVRWTRLVPALVSHVDAEDVISAVCTPSDAAAVGTTPDPRVEGGAAPAASCTLSDVKRALAALTVLSKLKLEEAQRKGRSDQA